MDEGDERTQVGGSPRGRAVTVVVGVVLAVLVAVLVGFASLYGWAAGLASAGAALLPAAVFRWKGRTAAALGCLVGAVAAAAFMTPRWLEMRRTDREIARLAADFCDVRVPDGVSVIECDVALAHSYDGDQCDYEARMVIGGRVPYDELQAFLAEVPVSTTGEFEEDTRIFAEQPSDDGARALLLATAGFVDEWRCW